MRFSLHISPGVFTIEKFHEWKNYVRQNKKLQYNNNNNRTASRTRVKKIKSEAKSLIILIVL